MPRKGPAPKRPVIADPVYNSPVVIVYFLGGLGALLGPLFGVIMADYWLVRKGKVNIPDLYSESPTAEYAYTDGINKQALIAATPAAIAARASPSAYSSGCRCPLLGSYSAPR